MTENQEIKIIDVELKDKAIDVYLDSGEICCLSIYKTTLRNLKKDAQRVVPIFENCYCFFDKVNNLGACIGMSEKEYVGHTIRETSKVRQ